jgi:hypothetical protein
MSTDTTTTRTATNPLADLHPDDVAARWQALGLDVLSDAELLEVAAARLAVPRVAPADSFVLHAPLELMARAGLLPYVEPASRELARQRIAWLATSFDAHGPAVGGGDVVLGTGGGSAAAATRLADAIGAGDLDAVDHAAVALCSSTTADELVTALVDLVVPRLAAAGHGSIFLYLLPRLMSASAPAPSMARGLLRDLARNPDWSVRWIDERDPSITPSGDLVERLLAPPSPGDPGSNFIYPTMSLVDRSGLAAELLDDATAGLSVAEARQALLRTAAWSMLQDDAGAAPYGWSHCLTMPQATLAVAPRSAVPPGAIAVAATYVLGFRATLGTVAVDPAWEPERGDALDAAVLLDAGPDRAAAAVWHADDADVAPYVRRITTHAALHHDAHLAKYTLACIDATRDDPAAGRLFLAAAAYLAAWWQAEDRRAGA